MALTGLTAVENGYSFSRPAGRSTEVGFAQGLGFAVIGTALGLLTGIAAASGPWGGNTAVMANDATPITASVPATSASVDHHAAPARFVPSQLTQRAPETAAPSFVRASLDTTGSHRNDATQERHVTSNDFVKKAIQAEPMVATAISTPVAPVAPVAAAMAVSTVPEGSESVSKPASMMIEGDLTVADFDASTGTVETREGKSFSVTQAGSDGNTLAWQDFAGHVHYKCTQAGSCTLAGSGVTASGAKLI
jgi:hypothetical protein